MENYNGKGTYPLNMPFVNKKNINLSIFKNNYSSYSKVKLENAS